jgi:hypothetical protein
MTKRIWVAVPALLALGACHGGSKGGVFAQRKGVPNEFVVGRAAPLVVPPDFALVPPRPGQPRPQEADSSTQALNALFGGQARSSAGETALLNQAGANTEAGIRSAAGSPATQVVNKGSATRDILNAPASSNPQANAGTTATPPSTTTPQ